MRPLRAAALALGLLAACREPARPAPVLDERHVVAVDGSTVRYDGRELDWNVDAARWQDVLGPCSRSTERILVWDDLGVFVYQDLYDLTPKTFSVLFGRVGHSPHLDTQPEFWPRTPFAGRLVVDGGLVHPGATVQAINDAKRPPPFRPGHLPTIFFASSRGFEQAIELGFDGSLTAYSIGKPPRSVSPPDYVARVRSHASRAGCRPRPVP